jgi:hypothetical protein
MIDLRSCCRGEPLRRGVAVRPDLVKPGADGLAGLTVGESCRLAFDAGGHPGVAALAGGVRPGWGRPRRSQMPVMRWMRAAFLDTSVEAPFHRGGFVDPIQHGPSQGLSTLECAIDCLGAAAYLAGRRHGRRAFPAASWGAWGPRQAAVSSRAVTGSRRDSDAVA